MKNRGIFIFIGPPYSGKETQTIPLSQKLGIPFYSMGQLIRDGRKNPEIEAAFQKYAAKGLHIPTYIKFKLLEEKMDQAAGGFILDNFPATQEDLDTFNEYLQNKDLTVNKVFYLNIGNEAMIKRFKSNPERGRADDTPETLKVRGDVQSKDRESVLQYYKNMGKLVEINGEQAVEAVSKKINEHINL